MVFFFEKHIGNFNFKGFSFKEKIVFWYNFLCFGKVNTKMKRTLEDKREEVV